MHLYDPWFCGVPGHILCPKSRIKVELSNKMKFQAQKMENKLNIDLQILTFLKVWKM